MNDLSPADCPAAELSCGKQRPVVSDGATRFRNENMSLSVVFPAGSQVCMTRSGNAPRGFFAVFGAPPGCPEGPERPPRFIELDSMFNANFDETVEDVLRLGCDPVSPDTQRRLGAVPLAMPGVHARVCESRGLDGEIAISLNFLSGPWVQVDELRSRRRQVAYFVSFRTTADHFDEDLARFRRVLASVRIATRG